MTFCPNPKHPCYKQNSPGGVVTTYFCSPACFQRWQHSCASEVPVDSDTMVRAMDRFVILPRAPMPEDDIIHSSADNSQMSLVESFDDFAS